MKIEKIKKKNFLKQFYEVLVAEKVSEMKTKIAKPFPRKLNSNVYLFLF